MNHKFKEIIAPLLHFTGRIPTSSKILYPFWLAAQLDEVKEEISFKNLPEALNGLVIAFCSDPHFGAFLSRERVIDLSRRLNAMQADIMILTGDYGSTSTTAAEFFEILPTLSAKYGVYASLGNHDLRGNKNEISKLITLIEKSGIFLMRNTAHSITIKNTNLCLCATDDILSGEPVFEPIKKVASSSDFVIFAPHSPDIIPQALEEPGFNFDLALCGHTHGGQLVVFGRSLHSSSRYGDKFRTGLMAIKDKQLLVTNGVGTSLLPMRLGCRPQIHRIILKKSIS